jgi:hypothetical protein
MTWIEPWIEPVSRLRKPVAPGLQTPARLGIAFQGCTEKHHFLQNELPTGLSPLPQSGRGTFAEGGPGEGTLVADGCRLMAVG